MKNGNCQVVPEKKAHDIAFLFAICLYNSERVGKNKDTKTERNLKNGKQNEK